MTTIMLTFIRHGETVDNIRTDPHLWAGWRDSKLTNHGYAQAQALAKDFSTKEPPLQYIFASDLQRARITAETLRDGQQDPANISFTVSKLLREQHFGEAEGRPFAWDIPADLEGRSISAVYARGLYPRIVGRTSSFPGGESSDDLRHRANEAIDEFLMPVILNAIKERKPLHIAVVSHGLFISECIPAVLARQNRDYDKGIGYAGLMNTAWTQLVIKGETSSNPEVPVLLIEVVRANYHEHLDNLKVQRGGIGRSAYDPKQSDIRAFFGGQL